MKELSLLKIDDKPNISIINFLPEGETEKGILKVQRKNGTIEEEKNSVLN